MLYFQSLPVFTGRLWTIIQPPYISISRLYITCFNKMCLAFTLLADVPTQVFVLPKCKILSLYKIRKHVMTYLTAQDQSEGANVLLAGHDACQHLQKSNCQGKHLHLFTWSNNSSLSNYSQKQPFSMLHAEVYPWLHLLIQQFLVWHRYHQFNPKYN